MPSTYTLNNGIELISTGEQSGTWGDTTNTNLSLLDTALDGQVTVTLPSAGTSGSPNTLAITDGAASDGRNRMVTFADGGDLGATAYVQLTPNDSEKIIYVRNTLAGSRSIILFQGTYNASNDYEVPAGTTAVVYFDGAGSGAVAANVFNNAYFDSLRLGGVSVTAIIDDDTMGTATATNIATSESIKAYVDAQVGANNELSEVLANGNTTGGTDIAVSTGDDITFADSSKAIFGAGSDLQIYHSGTQSYIDENGDGNLYIRTSGAGILLKDSTGAGSGNDMASFTVGGAANLAYNGSWKLATTATGIDVTGTAVTDGLTVQGIVEIDGSAFGNTSKQAWTRTDASWSINNETDFRIYGNTGDTTSPTSLRMAFATNGDITFYDTSGNASFVYDESAGSTFNEQGDNKDFRVESNGNTHALFVDAGSNHVNIGTATDLTGVLNVDGNVALSGAGTGSRYLALLSETDTYAGRLVLQAGAGSAGYGGSIIMYGHSHASKGGDVVLGISSGSGGQFRVHSGGTDQGTDRLTIGENGDFVTFPAANNAAVFNQAGVDSDFRVESDANTHALFVNAGNGRVGLNQGTPSATLHINPAGSDTWASGLWTTTSDSSYCYIDLENTGTSGTTWQIGVGGNGTASPYRNSLYFYNATTAGFFRAQTTEVAFNESSRNMDFRVESDSNFACFFVDAGNGRIGINQDVPGYTVDVVGGSNSSTDGIAVRPLNESQTMIYSFLGMRNTYFTQFMVDSGNTGSSDYFQFFAGTEDVNGELLNLADGGTIFNNGGHDRDFLVESDTNSHMLFVDALNNQVVVGGSLDLNAKLLVIGGKTTTIGIPENQLTVYDNSAMAANTGGAITFWGNYTAGGAGAEGASIEAVKANGTSGNYQYGIWLKSRTHGGAMDSRLYMDQDQTIFNESSFGTDFRVESDGNANAIFLDAGSNRLNIFGNAGSSTVDIVTGNGAAGDSVAGVSIKASDSNLTEKLNLGVNSTSSYAFINAVKPGTNNIPLSIQPLGAGVVFNDGGASNGDFRVESDNNSNMFVVDAGDDKVTIAGNQVFAASPTVNRGEFVTFNSNMKTVSQGNSTTVTMFTRSSTEVGACGTVYISAENSGGSVQFGIIIDFFFSNGALNTTTREAGSSQGTTTAAIAESGGALNLTVTYAGGLGGNIRFNAGGHASIASY